MGLTKTEVNLRRLLEAAPQQQNQAKLINYVATLREQLEQLAEEKTPEGLPRVSKAKVNEYSEKLEAVAAKLAPPVELHEVIGDENHSKVVGTPTRPRRIVLSSNIEESQESVGDESPGSVGSPTGLRRRNVFSSRTKTGASDNVKVDQSMLVNLDSAARGHIEKYRLLLNTYR